jgi:hypothetical protein
MKFDIGMYAVGHAPFGQTVATAAIDQPPTALQSKAERFAANTEKRQNIEWNFELFQNGKCTGKSDPYSGTRTSCAAHVTSTQTLRRSWIPGPVTYIGLLPSVEMAAC